MNSNLDIFKYSSSDLATILTEECHELGYRMYDPVFLDYFFKDCAPITLDEALSELHDNGYFPNCEICGIDGELYNFRTGKTIFPELYGNEYICVCETCRKKICRRVQLFSRQNGWSGGLYYSSPNVYQSLLDFFVLDRMVKNEMKGHRNESC